MLLDPTTNYRWLRRDYVQSWVTIRNEHRQLFPRQSFPAEVVLSSTSLPRNRDAGERRRATFRSLVKMPRPNPQLESDWPERLSTKGRKMEAIAQT